MIGNDVVDLHLAANESNWRRKGFLQKVFTPLEQEMITTTTDQEHIVWLLWSMKEAAYKLHQRKFRLPRRINWLIQECHILRKDNFGASGKVQIGKESYYTSSQISKDVIFTFAVNDKHLPVQNRLFKKDGEHAKEQLKKELAQKYLLDRNALSIKKDSSGVPFITYRHKIFFSSFSLSSHGDFSGYSCSLMNS